MQCTVRVHDRLEMLEERGLVFGSGVQFTVDTEFNGILHEHPDQVVCPHQTDQAPGRAGTPQPNAHMNIAKNLRSNYEHFGREQNRIRVRRRS
jgi:hypothetical protein